MILFLEGFPFDSIRLFTALMSKRDSIFVRTPYGSEISHDTIPAITDRATETADGWPDRPLKKFYTFLFVDCPYVSVRKEMETKNLAVYVTLGYDVNGIKDIYSIAETAKANNLKPYDYFEYLLTEIPKHLDDTDHSFLDNLLPWSPSLPANCRKPGKDEAK